MNRVNVHPMPLVIALLATIPAAVLAQVPPLGPDFEVVPFHEDARTGQEVAIDRVGQFMVTWAENFGRVRTCGYDRDGVEQGCLELDIPQWNSFSPVHVAAVAPGSFVAVWESFDNAGGRSLIKGRRIAVDGTPLGAEFEVTGSDVGYPRHPRVAFHPPDALLVVWADDLSDGTDNSDSSIQGRYFYLDGSPPGDRVQINTTTAGHQERPEIAVAPDGRFVMVWASQSSSGSDVSGWSIQGQRFTATTHWDGDEFQINTYTDGTQTEPQVAISDDAGFVAVWTSLGSSGVDDDGWSIQARRFTADGTPFDDDIEVNSYVAGDQLYPSVGIMTGGAFEVVWQSDGSFGDDDDTSIQRQAFASDASPRGPQLQVNTTTPGRQSRPDTSTNLDGDLMTIWTHAPHFDVPIWGRIFRSTVFADDFESGDRGAWSGAVP